MQRLVAYFAVVCAALLCCASAVHAATPVVKYSSYKALSAQLRSAPFSAAARDAIVASLRKSMQMYVFSDLACDSSIGAPAEAEAMVIPQKIDLLAAIEQIAVATYASQYDLYDAIGVLFSSLNDAHTEFTRPNAAFAFALPFKLSVRVVPSDAAKRPNQQSVFLTELAPWLTAYAQVYGGSPLANATISGSTTPAPLISVDGFEVVYIDRVPAVQYLFAIAHDDTDFHVGLSKDSNTRFNLLTAGFTADPNGPPGYFCYRSQRIYGIPQRGVVQLTVRDPKGDQSKLYDITFRFLGMEHDATNVTAQLSAPLKRHPILRSQQLLAHTYSIHSLQHPATAAQRLQLLGPSHPQAVFRADAALLKSLFHLESAGEISFDVLDDAAHTGVLRIDNFEPVSNAIFLNIVQQGITAHQHQFNGSALLIDLRANGGGDICLGYAVLRFLFPSLDGPIYARNAAEDSPFGVYDFKQAPASQRLADLGADNQRQFPLNNTCDFFTPCGWLRTDTQTQFTDETWYLPTQPRLLQRGSTTPAGYSNLVHDNCQSYFTSLAPSAVNPGYSADRVGLVAGGMCGSTCSVFSSFIQFNGLAKTISLGGLLDTTAVVDAQPMQFWSFPGGQVAHLEDIAAFAAAYGLSPTDPALPQAYPDPASSQSWAIREIYPWNGVGSGGQYPLEFLHIPANLHVGFTTNLSDTAAIYDTLLQKLDVLSATTCVPGLAPQACEGVANGQGVRPCVDGKLQTDGCVASACDAGYQLDAASGSCVACTAGFYSLANGACTACSQVSNVTQADGVRCHGRFTATAVSSDACPFVFVCESLPASASRRDFYIALGVLAPLAVMFLIAACVYRSKANAGRKNSNVNGNYATLEH